MTFVTPYDSEKTKRVDVCVDCHMGAFSICNHEFHILKSSHCGCNVQTNNVVEKVSLSRCRKDNAVQIFSVRGRKLHILKISYSSTLLS